MRCRSIVHL